MSTPPPHFTSTPATPHAEARTTDRHPDRASHRLRAWATITVHAVVDLFSFIFVPLLSVLQNKLDLASYQPALLIAVGALVSGLVQPAVALISDRHDTRAVGTIGFALSVVAVGLLGYAENFTQLVALQVIAAAGIGAFHPVAAAAVGQLYQPRRSLGLAWFYAAGMIGGVGGNLLAPEWVGHFSQTTAGIDTAAGMRSLAWLILPGFLFVALLAFAIHSTPHRRHDAHDKHHARDGVLKRAAWLAIAFLYLGNVLKFGVDTAVVALVKQWADALAAGQTFGPVSAEGASGAAASLQAAAIAGPLQAAKQIGMGAGGLALGFFLARRFERRALVLLPLLGAACLVALPRTHAWAVEFGLTGLGSTFALVVCALAGVGYGATVPLTLSIAQRLLPHRTSLASGLLLGGAWGVGSVGAPIAQQIAERISLEWAFAAAAIAALCAAALALPLKALMHAAVEDEPH
ncbi:MAG: MFS transporter [Phycisphaeraceae bacterium]|nr:MFS transporter [Phycisphaeraceae bacterium]